MTPNPKGSLPLFRVLGIHVYVHWAWIFVAIYQIQDRAHEYSSLAWNVVEYLALFLIVLLHEFGHALACRQVGGKADQIMLWPLGGVAYVAPPQRPGAVLWSIAAGPLVNVALFFVLTPILWFGRTAGWDTAMPDSSDFALNVWKMNLGLLIFNLLPVYPLDGGQILRALLWFPLGRARSLFAAVIVGFGGVALLAGLAFYAQSVWLGIIAGFVFLQCRRALTQARLIGKMEQSPRRTNFPCPLCGEPPPIGPFWRCPQCRTTFDPFENVGTCPSCHWRENEIQCLRCRKNPSLTDWRIEPPWPPIPR